MEFETAQNILETTRSSVIENLEKEYPRDYSRITKEDVFGISILNACLAVHSQFGGTEEELKAVKAGLEMERGVLVDKFIRVITPVALRESFLYPASGYEHPDTYKHILNKVDYLMGEDYPMEYIDYNTLSNRLYSRICSSAATEKELMVALELSGVISKHDTWKTVARRSAEILEEGETVGRVEQLLQEIHQGGYDVASKASIRRRPLLDHLADRPWEVANTLTFIFSGYPKVGSVKISSSISRYTSLYRHLPLIQEYYINKPLDLLALANSTKNNRFLEASLTLTKDVPLKDLENCSFFMDPCLAGKIVEGLEEEN